MPEQKKLSIIYIMKTLFRYSDEDHKLSQMDIVRLIKKDYGIQVDRKSIRRNLLMLIKAGYDIEYTEYRRVNRKGKAAEGAAEDAEVIESTEISDASEASEDDETTIMRDIYLVRDFTDSELHLMVDSILFNRNLPKSQIRTLVAKLDKMGSPTFSSRSRHIHPLMSNQPEHSQIFYTIELLDDAINSGMQVVFSYCDYGPDKKQHPRTDASGASRRYIVNPYQIIPANGFYYLLCNYEGHENLAHCRLDRIYNIQILPMKVKPRTQIPEFKNGFELPKHLAEHIYMFSGESDKVTFLADNRILNDVIDWFGTDASIKRVDDSHCRITVTVNLSAMKCWALQYAPSVTVLSPESLVADVRSSLQDALKRYEEQ